MRSPRIGRKMAPSGLVLHSEVAWPETRMAGDRELVDSVRRGDQAAFESLVERYTRMVGSIAYGITGDSGAAEDLVQEVFWKAYRAIRSLRDPGRFKAWVAGIAKSHSLDWVRRNRGRLVHLGSQIPAAEHLSSGEPSLGEHVERGEEVERVRRHLEGLPREYREVLVYKYLEGLSYKEIAERLGASEAAVESRLFRARRLLRERMEGQVRS